MEKKYFSYLNWLATNAEKRYAIVDYDDLNQLVGGVGRFTFEHLEKIYDAHCACFRCGAIVIESSGHHQLILSQRHITLKDIEGNFYHRRIYDQFIDEVESHSSLQSLKIKLRMKRPVKRRRQHRTYNFYKLIKFDGSK
ncbi:hypothetical protein [Thalassolituus oleivorans]|uniref:hypothetical protein n=1 Tax=Thalassolituus oleivorans TaxID=187493 RepID=UPI0023F4D5F6|nr:hypothetical protein [Thalassolituus oleivorans]